MLNKNDFIEIEFIGRVKGGEIFDTNIPEEAKKIELEMEGRPLIICLGQSMILPALEEFLIGKEIGKYSIELQPEKAFGSRNPQMIKTMPLKIFIEKQIMPRPGMVFNFDNTLGKVSAVSGGRVIVDFNHPLANKTVVYEINVKRKIEDEKEKINCVFDFFFRKRFEFEVKDKKVMVKAEAQLKPLFQMFNEKFKEMTGFECEVIEVKSEKSEEKKTN